MKQIFCSMWLCLCYSSYAQKTVIRATVKDSVTQEALPFATIVLLNDTIFLKGKATDSIGRAEFILDANVSQLSVSCLGYKTKKVQTTALLKDQLNILYLQPVAPMLSSINIVAQKISIQQMVDRKVYDFTAAEQTAGMNVQQLLGNLPELFIEQSDGTVYVRGNEKAEVYVNMKKSSLSLSELLTSIPAASIAKIEIITTPSAKLQSSGIAGIVNIVLKQNKEKGLGLNTVLDIGQFATGITFNGHYTSKKYNLKFNTQYKKSNFTNRQWIARKYSPSEFENIFTPYRSNGDLIAVKTGFDFFPSKKHQFSLMADYTNDKHSATNASTYYNLSSGADYSFLHQNKHIHHVATANANYRFAPSENQFLEIDYYINTSKNEYPISNFTNSQLTNSQLLHETFTIQSAAADYTAPISKKLQMESGYLLTSQLLKSDRLLSNTGQPVKFEAFDYNEITHALYANASLKLDKFSFQSGLRFEAFQSRAADNAGNRTLSNNNLFPSLHISYNISLGSKLLFGYSKRIQRADFHQLNALQIVNPLFQWVYNPAINPEFSHNMDLNFNTAAPLSTFSVGLFYRNKHDLILWKEYAENNQQFFKYENAGQLNTYGLESSFSTSFRDKFSGRISSNFSYYEYKGNTAMTWTAGITSNMQLRVTYKPLRTISTELSYFYYFKNQSYFSYTNPRQKIDFNFHWRFYKDKWTLNLRLIDIFNSNRIMRTSEVAGLEQNTVWDFVQQKRNVLLSLTYILSKVNRKQRESKERAYIKTPID